MTNLFNSNLWLWFAGLLLSLLLCPLLFGIINKVKAFFAGRRGPKVLQLYFDMAKLLKKERIYSTASGGIIQIAPVANLAALLGATLFMPYALCNSPLSFDGDVLLFLYLLGIGRVITVLGALDTGSSFEGMGASREIQFSAICEVVFFSILIFFALMTGSLSLCGMFNTADTSCYLESGTSLLLIAVAIFIVMLSENCRVPFDDPETHLELTMIHEAMILDNGGPDLALIHYGASLKMWLLATCFVMAILPCGNMPVWCQFAVYFGAMFLTAALIGVVESIMARFRFRKVPQTLLAALCLGGLAIVLLLIFEGRM